MYIYIYIYIYMYIYIYIYISYFHYCKPLEPVPSVYVPCESDISCFALPLLSSPKRSCAKKKFKHIRVKFTDFLHKS